MATDRFRMKGQVVRKAGCNGTFHSSMMTFFPAERLANGLTGGFGYPERLVASCGALEVLGRE